MVHDTNICSQHCLLEHGGREFQLLGGTGNWGPELPLTRLFLQDGIRSLVAYARKDGALGKAAVHPSLSLRLSFCAMHLS